MEKRKSGEKTCHAEFTDYNFVPNFLLLEGGNSDFAQNLLISDTLLQVAVNLLNVVQYLRRHKRAGSLILIQTQRKHSNRYV